MPKIVISCSDRRFIALLLQKYHLNMYMLLNRTLREKMDAVFSDFDVF